MNKLFFSIRWKLVSTYLLLVLITLLLINSFINASLTKYLMDEKKENLITQSNIIADRVSSSVESLNNPHTYAYIEGVIKSLSLQIDSRVLLIDRKGIVLIDSYDDYYNENLSFITEVQEAMDGTSSAQEYNFENIGKTIYVSVPVFQEGRILGVVLMSSSPDDIFERIGDISANFVKLSLAAIVITAVVSFIFTDILSTPIESLTHTVRQVSSGNNSLKARVYSNDELGKLSDAFNIMITKLYHVDQRRKDFVSNVSHELRTPLTSMKIIAETLIHSKPDSTDIYDEFLMDINTELDRLNRIIDTLLNLTNLEKEELDLEYSLVSVNNLIQSVISTIKPLAEKKNIDISYVHDEKINIFADQLKIRQCLINIINNAVKYTPDDGKIYVHMYLAKEEVVIRVKDTGIGIPEEDVPHIFDRFYRVDSARARETGGSGLGLSIANQIISLHQGHIDVESVEGKGTTFIIALPYQTEQL